MQPAAVLIPVKAFGAAKLRLAPALAPPARAALARAMATRVVEAADPLPVTVVCDHPEVAAWAAGAGADVCFTPGLGLNGAVAAGVSHLAGQGVGRVVVAHADLPFAEHLADLAGGEGATFVPDRRDDGTNVAVVPAGAGFAFAYGPGSFRRHVTEAERLGLAVRVVRVERLGWDVDLPADLVVPAHLGTLP